MSGCTKYFDYKGKRYYEGAIFKCYNFLPINNINENIIQVKFKKKLDTLGKVLVVCQSNNMMYDIPTNQFLNSIIQVIENNGKENIIKYNQQFANSKNHIHYIENGEDYYYYKDGSYYNGWAWYIIVMIGSMIFKGFPVIWVLASITFFTWKYNKVRGK